MILAGIDDVTVGFVIRTHVLHYTILCCIMQDPKPGAAPPRLLSPGVNAGALRWILVTIFGEKMMTSLGKIINPTGKEWVAYQ